MAETDLADFVPVVVAYCTVSLLQVQVEDVVVVEEAYLFVIYKSMSFVTLFKKNKYNCKFIDFQLINTVK